MDKSVFTDDELKIIDEAKKIYPEYIYDKKPNYNFKDMTGMKFGRLKVLYRGQENYRRKPSWVCLCNCGNVVQVIGERIRSGNTNSCGCYNIDRIIERNKETKKKFNDYDLTSFDYGVGYTYKGEPFYFDKEDYDKIKKYSWSIDTQGYVVSNKYDASSDKWNGVKIHRIVTNNNDGMVVDHINHNKTDNRKENLRVVTNQQNCMNRTTQSDNTSGYSGVHFDKRYNKWISRLFLNGKAIYLGSFDTKEEAFKSRKQAEKEYFGDFRYKDNEHNIV